MNTNVMQSRELTLLMKYSSSLPPKSALTLIKPLDLTMNYINYREERTIFRDTLRMRSAMLFQL